MFTIYFAVYTVLFLKKKICNRDTVFDFLIPVSHSDLSRTHSKGTLFLRCTEDCFACKFPSVTSIVSLGDGQLAGGDKF